MNESLDVIRAALWQAYVSVAKDVIAGKYGDGDVRINALRGAGFKPEIVQAIVNRLIRSDS